MRVKELRNLLPETEDSLEVLVRPRLSGYDLDAKLFRLAGVRKTLEPDTAESVLVLDCDQEE